MFESINVCDSSLLIRGGLGIRVGVSPSHRRKNQGYVSSVLPTIYWPRLPRIRLIKYPLELPPDHYDSHHYNRPSLIHQENLS
jgi:hypothetical protein